LPPKPGHKGQQKEESRQRRAWSGTHTDEHPIFKVIQLSDLHFDFEYQNGTEAQCGKPICCQGAPDPHAKLQAGYWGTLASVSWNFKLTNFSLLFSVMFH
jgi:hypothetical protein